MIERLASAVFANSLIRRAFAVGGSAAVLVKGDATSGAILVIMAEKGVVQGLFDRQYDGRGHYVWVRKSSQLLEKKEQIYEYIARETGRDPDLWVIELDVPNAERFTAEMATGD